VKSFVVVAMALFLFGCGEDDEPEESRADKIAALTANANAGRTTYDQICATCHGPDGAGTPTGDSLIESKYTKLQTIDIILNGSGDMTPYPGLADQAIADVTAYTLSLQE